MVFKTRKELNGEIDPNINTEGRIKPLKSLTKRQLRDRELLTLARKIKPLMADAIGTAATIMRNKEASHAAQLKACVILLDAYKELVDDLYDQDELPDDSNEKVEEIQPQPVLFSLKVLDDSTEKN